MKYKIHGRRVRKLTYMKWRKEIRPWRNKRWLRWAARVEDEVADEVAKKIGKPLFDCSYEEYVKGKENARRRLDLPSKNE